MRNLIFLLVLLSLSVNSRPVTELVRIDYPIEYVEGYTAYSDGSRIYLGSDLIDDLTEEQKGYVILHEAAHNVYEHQKKLITSAVINCHIKDPEKHIKTCVSLHKYAHYKEYQKYEEEADKASNKLSKRIGYTKDVCNVFTKLKNRFGEVKDKSTHPSYESRYNKCMEIMSKNN